jgi:general secretion pathway protein D
VKARLIRRATSHRGIRPKKAQVRRRSPRPTDRARPIYLILRVFVCLLIAFACWAASSEDVARQLAAQALKAQLSGETVRAYLLFAEAVKRDPHNPSYRTGRDSLETAAKLLRDNNIESADVSADIKEAERAADNPGLPALEPATAVDWSKKLQPIPHLDATPRKQSFDLHSDEIGLFQKVASSYGLRAVWDPQLTSQPNIRFDLGDADVKTALEALTAVTHTFVFPISPHAIFFARDTEDKRNELEPTILLTMAVPEALNEKDVVDAANAVRGVLSLRSFGWDSFNRTVLVRDRATRARVAQSLLEALLLPKAQVSIEVQFLTLDSQTNYHYGLALPTSYALLNFGHIGHFQSILPSLTSAMNIAMFGGGSTLLGLGVADSTLFATYSKNVARTTYQAVMIASDGQTANLHVGEKYPIPQTLYSGFQQSSASIYNPIGQVTLEDLGLILKMTPRVNGEGDISLDVEAEFKTLSGQTFNTVPAIAQRKFTGSVVLREGEWAVITGLDESSTTITRNGIAGISNIRGLNQALSENTRARENSNTLVVIKPTIVRLPMSNTVTPQYLLGPIRGERVVL